MSFAEATRIFNIDQSNQGSFIPATGDASNQAPCASRRPSSHSPGAQAQRSLSQLGTPPGSGEGGAGQNRLAPALATGSGGGGWGSYERTSGSGGLDRPHEVASGPAAVVPAAMPSQEQVRANPGQMVEIRNPDVDNVIDEEEEEYCELDLLESGPSRGPQLCRQAEPVHPSPSARPFRHRGSLAHAQIRTAGFLRGLTCGHTLPSSSAR